MAFALLSHVAADLTLGKPALPWLPASACVRDALAALKQLGGDVSEISVWDCSAKNPSSDFTLTSPQHLEAALAPCLNGSVCSVDRSVREVFTHRHCLCIGKICMQKIVCYLASEESLCSLSKALDAPVVVLLDDSSKSTVRHIDPDASLLEALELIAAGAQNLVVPISDRAKRNGARAQLKPIAPQKAQSVATPILKDHNGKEYCWLTQEDILRFLLGSIGVFSPLPVMSIEALGLIKTDVRMVSVEQSALVALDMIKEACQDMSAVAIVNLVEGEPGAVQLVGDISRLTLQMCNETAALALATLSAGDLLIFVQDCKNPPEVLINMIRTRVNEMLGLEKGSHFTQLPGVEDANSLLQKLEMWEESSSEDEESGAESPMGHHDFSRKWQSARFRNSRKGFIAKARSGPIFCNPKSSLIAVLLQVLAHREHYVWVTSEDDSLLGIVTLPDILTVMLGHINVFN